MQKGDQNTSFFHAACSERRRRNKIGRLKNDEGVWVENEEEKRGMIAQYFKTLFSSNRGNNSDQLLDVVERKVTEDMNELLTSAYRSEEIKEALDSIGDLKAPGPDGMPAVFYKNFWDLMGEKITSEVQEILNGGQIPQEWNETTIVLIPKVKTFELIKDLRPISVCNVLYKIVSKVLANRLKKILPEVISQSQSAFFPGRLISDNILVAYELTHYMRQKRNGETGYAALKLDMSKAYDRVEWGFLKDMMLKLGFNQEWTQLIMKCITFVTYRIRVDGELIEVIQPERGLQQGIHCPHIFSCSVLKVSQL